MLDIIKRIFFSEPDKEREPEPKHYGFKHESVEDLLKRLEREYPTKEK